MGKAAHAARDRKKTAGGLRLLRTGEASSTCTHSSLKQPYTVHSVRVQGLPDSGLRHWMWKGRDSVEALPHMVTSTAM